jgi:predicted dehydrogenase
MTEFRQAWALPANPKPIVIIGAGGIVRDAHLPAYRKAGFSIAGIHDLDAARAAELASAWGIGHRYETLEAAVQGNEVVYDLAVPPTAVASVLHRLPRGATVLIQKPMGANLAEAREIQRICRDRELVAALNFQLRFSPMMLAIRDIIERGTIGDLVDIDIHLTINTPWAMFPFLRSMGRVEIAVHSIHYLDLVRSIAGEPKSVFARSLADPRVEGFAQTRTSAILDYGDALRCSLSINHNHGQYRRFQDSMFRFEGTKGAVALKVGVLLDYPDGEPDELWLASNGGDWQQIPLVGGWFPDAFVGTMSNLQRFAAGEDSQLWTSVDDSIHTMALAEACFVSAATPGVLLPTV